MKITLPVHHFPPRYSAGAELYTFRLARWLQAHGHQVEVVCIESIDQGESGELQATEDRYQGITVRRLSFNLADADTQRWGFDNPLLRDWFARYFERTRPDLVHFQAGYLIGVAPLEVAYAAHIPIVLTLHDYWYLCPRITLQRGDGSLCTAIPADPAGCAWCLRLESRRYRYPDRLTAGMLGHMTQALALTDGRRTMADRRTSLHAALTLPNAVVAPSRFLAERIAPFVNNEQLHISRYGLDLVPFEQSHSASYGEILRIGFIGQVAPHKGVHLLIEAFRKLHVRECPIELHIYGALNAHPTYIKRLHQLASDDPRITFHGRFENSGVVEILTNIDVAVSPSVWFENSPLAIMEAHASGTPVVTAALGGMAELVQHGVDGLHFKPGDAFDLAHCLQRLIDEPGLLANLRAGVVKPRSIEDEMRQLFEIYSALR